MLTSLEEIQQNGLEALGIYISFYPGIVVDNNDPENLYRLKVKLPTISGEQPLESWALPFGAIITDASGLIVTPQEGDNVWVQFQQGNLEFPVWSFGAMPTAKKLTVSDKKNHIWQNPRKQRIELTDVVELNGKEEFAVLGNKLETLLKDLLAAIKNLKVTCGGAGSPSTAIINIAEFQSVEQKINEILSEKVKLG
jgi:hypothetical protein